MDWATPNTTGETDQGSKKWHQWRGKGLGSSDAPVLLGVSPWKTLFQLYLDKIGEAPPFAPNSWMIRGTKLEPEVRRMYEQKTGISMPAFTATHPRYEILRASFDGINKQHRKVLEIKCPGQTDHQKALLGEVPEKYMPQLQWLLMVSGYDDLDYVSWDGEIFTEPVIIPVKSDPIMQTALISRALDFWNNHVIPRVPPPSPEVKVDDEDTKKLLAEYAFLKGSEASIQAKLSEIRDQIKARLVSDKMIVSNYKVSWVERKGAVDYAKVPQLQDVDLEPYRKPSTRIMDIREIK